MAVRDSHSWLRIGAIFTFLGGAAWGIWWLAGGLNDAQPTGLPVEADVPLESGPVVVGVKETAAWTDRMVRGDRVEFRGVDADGEELVLGSFATIGKLDSRQVSELIAAVQKSLDAAHRAWAEKSSRAAVEGTADAHLEEISALRTARRWEALMRHASQGKGWAFHTTAGDGLKVRSALPKDWVCAVISNATTTQDGQGVEVVLALDPSVSPELRAMEEEVEGVVRYRNDDYIYRFNSLPYDKRKERMEAHRSAVEELNAGRPAGMTDAMWSTRKTTLAGHRIDVPAAMDWARMELVPLDK